ncbi:hypothetical protein N2152v2_005151 [Parachlorella kessleri]
MSTGTTETGSQVRGEGEGDPFMESLVRDLGPRRDRGNREDDDGGHQPRHAVRDGAGGGLAGASETVGTQGSLAGGGITGSDYSGTGYHGATGVIGGAGDYGGARHGGEDRVGFSGMGGFGHETADAKSHASKAQGATPNQAKDTGYASGLENTGARGAGTGAETADLARNKADRHA